MRILVEGLIDIRLEELGWYLERHLKNIYVKADEDSYYDSYNLTFNVIDRYKDKRGLDSIYCRITLEYPNGNKHIDHFTISLIPQEHSFYSQTSGIDEVSYDEIFKINSADDVSPYSFGEEFNTMEEVLAYIKRVEHID